MPHKHNPTCCWYFNCCVICIIKSQTFESVQWGKTARKAWRNTKPVSACGVCFVVILSFPLKKKKKNTGNSFTPLALTIVRKRCCGNCALQSNKRIKKPDTEPENHYHGVWWMDKNWTASGGNGALNFLFVVVVLFGCVDRSPCLLGALGASAPSGQLHLISLFIIIFYHATRGQTANCTNRKGPLIREAK